MNVEDIILKQIDEIKADVKEIKHKVHEMDKHIFGNKIKLSFFIGGISLFFSIGWSIISTKIKNLL